MNEIQAPGYVVVVLIVVIGLIFIAALFRPDPTAGIIEACMKQPYMEYRLSTGCIRIKND
jgi:hypothetical protein